MVSYSRLHGGGGTESQGGVLSGKRTRVALSVLLLVATVFGLAHVFIVPHGKQLYQQAYEKVMPMVQGGLYMESESGPVEEKVDSREETEASVIGGA